MRQNNYVLKQVPEDFLVIEQPVREPSENGNFVLLWMKKREYTTVDAVNRVSDALGTSSKNIGFAGNKDKKAVTEQMISLRRTDKISKEFVESLKIKDIELEFMGYSIERINLGDLKGNKFIITVRDIEKKPENIDFFPNFFGEQRFSKNNADIGRFLVKKDFRSAVDLLLESHGRQEIAVRDYLEDKPNDFVGALRTISKKTLKLYVHSYQSFLWNKCLEEHIERRQKVDSISLIGFEIKEKTDIISSIMEEESLSERDFIIREFPELTSEGGERNAFCKVKDLKIGSLEDDELNDGMKKVKIEFILPKGSYATEFIRFLFTED